MSHPPTLTLCAIVRNEEFHLQRCLESVRDLADEVVVVDTGSTDRTEEVARSFGARVFRYCWQDDFGLARNFGLEQATGEWILVLDADESIATRDHEPIRRLLRRRDLNAVTAFQRHYLASGTVVGWQPGPGGYEEGRPYPGYFDVECRRLFRNQPWLRFRNRVHEELGSNDPAHPLVQERAAWVVHHYGKADNKARLREKGEAYRRIGLKKVQDDPGNPLAHYELGIQYLEFRQPREALSSFEQALALAPNFRDSALRMALCHGQLRQYGEALKVLEDASRTLPQYGAEIALEEGNVHQQRNERRAAERAFVRAITIRPGMAVASVNLALLYRGQGRHAEALEGLERALEHCPGDPDLLTLRAQTRSDLGDDDGALADLEQLGSRTNAPRLRARILARHRRFAEAHECLQAIDDAPDAETLSLRGAVALGLGNVEEAVAQLRRSLDAGPTLEAALNLSTALEARGDHPGALGGAAEALGLSPEEPAALARFARLAGGRLGHRTAVNPAGTLTLFFYQPDSLPFDSRTPRTCGLDGTERAVVHLAKTLAKLGHRIVVFNNCEEPGRHDLVEYARWDRMPARSLVDRPDVVVGVRLWRTIGRTRLAPLQVFWPRDTFDQPSVEGLSDEGARAEIDFFIFQSDRQATTFQRHHRVPAWRIARGWETVCLAAMTSETPLLDRIAKYVMAGRTRLAARMLEHEAPPAGLQEGVWDGLEAVVAWKAGLAEVPSDETLRQIAVCVPAFRREPLLSATSHT
jgi:tetratricopeptide (TPR) repeat protein